MNVSRRVSGSVLVMVLTLAACGSSGPKTLSADDLATQMNAICRTAERALTKLDPNDKTFYTDIGDVIQTALDDFGKLKPPKALQADFDDYTANLDDQSTEIAKIGRALKSGDTATASTASDKLTKLAKDGDDLASSLGADKCVGVGDSVGGSTPTTDAATTTTAAPATTATPATTTTAPTTVPDTVTPNTPLPIDTSPDTEPIMTAPPSSGGSTSALDASQFFKPINGYSWGVLEDLSTTVTPLDDPVLGSALAAYEAGVMTSTSDGSLAYVYIAVLQNSAPWTADQKAAYYNFELAGGGTDITLPNLGIAAQTKQGVAQGFDGAAFTIDGVGVAVFAPTGKDVVALLEGFVAAQQSGG